MMMTEPILMILRAARAAVVPLALPLVFLAACSSQGPARPTPLLMQTVTPEPSPTATVFVPTATPAPTPTPLPPKPIQMVLLGEPETLHPLYATSLAARTALAPVFVGCIGQDETGAPIGLGCERLPTLENGGARYAGEGDDRHLEITFTIRSGWRWTDGAPVVAQDAIYAWQLVMAPEAQLRDPLTQKVFSMAAPDERTIVVSFMSLAQARAAAAGTLRGDVAFEYFSQQGDYDAYAGQAAPLADANYWAVVRWLPSHLLKDVGPKDQTTSAFAARPVGDGAYEVTSWQPGTELALTRSKLPFPLTGAGDSLAPGIVFHFAPDAAVAAQMIRSGAAQVSSPIPLALVSPAPEGAPMPVAAFEQLAFNTERPPFDDARVRRAARAALDAAAIMADPDTGPVTAPATLDAAGLFHGRPASILAAGNNLAAARALLAEAGWQCSAAPCARPVTRTNGTVVTQTLEFTLVTNERSPRNALSQVIQKQLGAAGFGVNIQIVHGLGRSSRLFAPYEQGGILLTRDFDAALFQAPSLDRFRGFFDCASVPTEQDHSTAQGNVSGLCDKDLDRLAAEAEEGEQSVSEKGGAEAISKALDAVDAASPVVALYSPLAVLPARDVGGIRFRGFGLATWNAWDWRQLARP